MKEKRCKEIQRITKDLELNDGKGFTFDYVQKVLSPKNKRKNRDIERISYLLNQSKNRSIESIISNYDALSRGKRCWTPLELKEFI